MAITRYPHYYATDEEIGELIGVGFRQVQNLARDGIIEKTEYEPLEGRKLKRFDVIPTLSKYIAHLRGRTNDRTEQRANLAEKKLRAEIALKESQGELHRLKTDIAAGRYVPVEEIQADYTRFFVELKKLALALPARVCGPLAGQIDPVEARRIEKTMSAEVNSVLNSFVSAAIRAEAPRDG